MVAFNARRDGSSELKEKERYAKKMRKEICSSLALNNSILDKAIDSSALRSLWIYLSIDKQWSIE